MNIFYPYLKKETKINKFDVFIENIDLFQSATLRVLLYADDADTTIDRPIEIKRYILTGEDYSKWTDDSYITNYVKRKLRDEYETITGRMVYNKLITTKTQ